MSSERGNAKRSRPQKYQNQTVYKKDLYGTTPITKSLDSLRIEGLCPRCTHIIEWKIKFKKYKKLTAPAKCAKCLGRTVKEAYHTICRPCAVAAEKCPKCCELHTAPKTETSSMTSSSEPFAKTISDTATPGGDSESKSVASSEKTDPPRAGQNKEDSSDFSEEDEEDESEEESES